MNKKDINNIIDNIITKNKLSDIILDNIYIEDDLNIKCSVSSRASTIRAFQEYGEKYGLTTLKPDESGSAFTLYDHKHDTYLDFSKAFVNKNIIDIHNNGEKEINLEEIFRVYADLPS